MGIVALASCSDDPKVQEPSADFSFAVSDLTVTFSDASLNGDSYVWSFGDGNTSNEKSPIHTYLEGGDYEVSLAVTNAGGTSFTRQTVTLETEVDYVELLAGRWKMANTAGALGVGPGPVDLRRRGQDARDRPRIRFRYPVRPPFNNRC